MHRRASGGERELRRRRGVPVLLLLAYAGLRLSTALFQELRGLVFARVLTRTTALADRLKEWQLRGGDVALVIGGPDAFVMDVASYEDFAVAIRRKLLRELSTATALLK